MKTLTTHLTLLTLSAAATYLLGWIGTILVLIIPIINMVTAHTHNKTMEEVQRNSETMDNNRIRLQQKTEDLYNRFK